MLFAAIAAVVVAVILGLWLASMYLVHETPPGHSSVVAALHGIAGATCVVLLYLTLHRPGPPPGKFGWTAFFVLAFALAGGLTILTFHLRRKPPSSVLIAMHASLGIAGAVMLAAYFSSPASFGR